MSRDEVFAQLMDSVYEFSKTFVAVQNTPHARGAGSSVSAAELYLLCDIGSSEGITITELAARNVKSKSAMSQLVERLDQKEMILRTRLPKSKKVELRLSEKGQCVYEEQLRKKSQTCAHLLAELGAFSEGDFLLFAQLVEQLHENIEAAVQHPAVFAESVL